MGVLDSRATSRVSLTRLLQKYVEKTQFSECSQVWMSSLCQYYQVELFDKLYKMNLPDMAKIFKRIEREVKDIL